MMLGIQLKIIHSFSIMKKAIVSHFVTIATSDTDCRYATYRMTIC